MHVSCTSVSDGGRYVIIVLVVSIVIPHVLVYVVPRRHTQICARLSLPIGFGRVDPVVL